MVHTGEMVKLVQGDAHWRDSVTGGSNLGEVTLVCRRKKHDDLQKKEYEGEKVNHRLKGVGRRKRGDWEQS